MKINDIEVGKEYGVIDSNSSRHHLPRQVKVLEIVTVEEVTYGNYSQTSTSRNVRRVKVKFLDDKQSNSRWSNNVSTAQKGSTKVLSARQVVAAWSELRADIKAKIETTQKADALRVAIEKRLRKLLGRNAPWVSVADYRVGNVVADVTFRGKELEKILTWAEKGKEVSHG